MLDNPILDKNAVPANAHQELQIAIEGGPAPEQPINV